MIPLFSNATVAWNEIEIVRRETLVREIPLLLHSVWQSLNPAVRMARCETPVLVPALALASHIEAGFDLIGPCGERGYLRPETTAGTYAMFRRMFPQEAQALKATPFCLWQVGLSFRDEANPDTMRASKLRLVQFYQMEFQLFLRPGSHADYLGVAVGALARRYGGTYADAAELPHYSRRTVDWHMAELEVAGCSVRTDWPMGDVVEIAIGLDRLVALQLQAAL